MNASHTPLHSQPRESTRSLVFHGTRQDALERLPSLGRDERIELSAYRISLITRERRVDLRFGTEARYRNSTSAGVFTALEFTFIGDSDRAIDLFVYRFRVGGEPVLH